MSLRMKTGKSVSISMGTLWQFAFIIAKITVIVKKHVFHNSKRTMQIAHVRLVKLFMTGAE